MNNDQRKQALDEAALEAVAGGAGVTYANGVFYTPDGKQHPAILRSDSWCPNFHCKRCGYDFGSHAPRCQLSENLQTTCYGCVHFESMNNPIGYCLKT